MKALTLKYLVVIFFSLISIQGYCQDKVSLGVNFTPIYSKNMYQKTSASDNLDRILDLNEYDQWQFGWSAGFEVYIPLKDQFLASFGIGFKRINDIYYSDLPVYYNTTTFFKANTSETISLNYLTAPIGLTYNFLTLAKSCEIGVNSTLSAEILLSESQSTNQFTTNHTKINLIINIGIPFKFSLSNRLDVTVAPNYGISLNKINMIKFDGIDFNSQRNHYVGFKTELRLKKY